MGAATLFMLEPLQQQGFALIPSAVAGEEVARLRILCEERLTVASNTAIALSRRGHVYAARNVVDAVPELNSVWQTGALHEFLQNALGEGAGLVRVLFFDKPPDRTWSLPWHTDRTIAVVDSMLASSRFSCPTHKAGVPHVLAPDDVLMQMLTLRIHLDDVTGENGPLQVIPGSHTSSDSQGSGIEHPVTMFAEAGDVLAMRPLLTHASGASLPGTTRHRRIVHLEFSASRHLPDGFAWHRFVPLIST